MNRRIERAAAVLVAKERRVGGGGPRRVDQEDARGDRFVSAARRDHALGHQDLVALRLDARAAHLLQAHRGYRQAGEDEGVFLRRLNDRGGTLIKKATAAVYRPLFDKASIGESTHASLYVDRLPV